jgi:hypothetical protein
LFRQPGDLVVEHRLEVAPVGVADLRRGQLVGRLRGRRALRRRGPRAQRDAVGDLVQPRRDHLAAPDRGGLAREDQERRLESVLGLVRVAQHALAERQHHRPVPPREHFERRLVAPADEVLQELRVGKRAARLPGDEPAERVEDRGRRFARHVKPVAKARPPA